MVEQPDGDGITHFALAAQRQEGLPLVHELPVNLRTAVRVLDHKVGEPAHDVGQFVGRLQLQLCRVSAADAKLSS